MPLLTAGGTGTLPSLPLSKLQVNTSHGGAGGGEWEEEVGGEEGVGPEPETQLARTLATLSRFPVPLSRGAHGRERGCQRLAGCPESLPLLSGSPTVLGVPKE